MLPNNGLMYFSVMTTSSVSFSPDQRSFINCPFNASQTAYLCGAIGSVVAVADQVISAIPTFVYGGQNGCQCFQNVTPSPVFPDGLFPIVPACARGVIVSGGTFPIIGGGVTIDTFTRAEVDTGDTDLCLFNGDGQLRGGALGWTGSGFLRLGYRFNYTTQILTGLNVNIGIPAATVTFDISTSIPAQFVTVIIQEYISVTLEVNITIPTVFMTTTISLSSGVTVKTRTKRVCPPPGPGDPLDPDNPTGDDPDGGGGGGCGEYDPNTDEDTGKGDYACGMEGASDYCGRQTGSDGLGAGDCEKENGSTGTPKICMQPVGGTSSFCRANPQAPSCGCNNVSMSVSLGIGSLQIDQLNAVSDGIFAETAWREVFSVEGGTVSYALLTSQLNEHIASVAFPRIKQKSTTLWGIKMDISPSGQCPYQTVQDFELQPFADIPPFKATLFRGDILCGALKPSQWAGLRALITVLVLTLLFVRFMRTS